jgi:hypothetical protein
VLKFVAWCYASAVVLLGSWAWVVDVALRNSAREHLLPDTLLAMVTMPLSLTLEFFASLAPRAFASHFVGLALLSLLGAAQVLLLFWFTRLAAKASRLSGHS